MPKRFGPMYKNQLNPTTAGTGTEIRLTRSHTAVARWLAQKKGAPNQGAHGPPLREVGTAPGRRPLAGARSKYRFVHRYKGLSAQVSGFREADLDARASVGMSAGRIRPAHGP